MVEGEFVSIALDEDCDICHLATSEPLVTCELCASPLPRTVTMGFNAICEPAHQTMRGHHDCFVKAHEVIRQCNFSPSNRRRSLSMPSSPVLTPRHLAALSPPSILRSRSMPSSPRQQRSDRTLSDTINDSCTNLASMENLSMSISIQSFSSVDDCPSRVESPITINITNTDIERPMNPTPSRAHSLRYEHMNACSMEDLTYSRTQTPDGFRPSHGKIGHCKMEIDLERPGSRCDSAMQEDTISDCVNSPDVTASTSSDTSPLSCDMACPDDSMPGCHEDTCCHGDEPCCHSDMSSSHGKTSNLPDEQGAKNTKGEHISDMDCYSNSEYMSSKMHSSMETGDNNTTCDMQISDTLTGSLTFSTCSLPFSTFRDPSNLIESTDSSSSACSGYTVYDMTTSREVNPDSESSTQTDHSSLNHRQHCQTCKLLDNKTCNCKHDKSCNDYHHSHKHKHEPDYSQHIQNLKTEDSDRNITQNMPCYSESSTDREVDSTDRNIDMIRCDTAPDYKDVQPDNKECALYHVECQYMSEDMDKNQHASVSQHEPSKPKDISIRLTSNLSYDTSKRQDAVNIHHDMSGKQQDEYNFSYIMSNISSDMLKKHNISENNIAQLKRYDNLLDRLHHRDTHMTGDEVSYICGKYDTSDSKQQLDAGRDEVAAADKNATQRKATTSLMESQGSHHYGILNEDLTDHVYMQAEADTTQMSKLAEKPKFPEMSETETPKTKISKLADMAKDEIHKSNRNKSSHYQHQNFGIHFSTGGMVHQNVSQDSYSNINIRHHNETDLFQASEQFRTINRESTPAMQKLEPTTVLMRTKTALTHPRQSTTPGGSLGHTIFRNPRYSLNLEKPKESEKLDKSKLRNSWNPNDHDKKGLLTEFKLLSEPVYAWSPAQGVKSNVQILSEPRHTWSPLSKMCDSGVDLKSEDDNLSCEGSGQDGAPGIKLRGGDVRWRRQLCNRSMSYTYGSHGSVFKIDNMPSTLETSEHSESGDSDCTITEAKSQSHGVIVAAIASLKRDRSYNRRRPTSMYNMRHPNISAAFEFDTKQYLRSKFSLSRQSWCSCSQDFLFPRKSSKSRLILDNLKEGNGDGKMFTLTKSPNTSPTSPQVSTQSESALACDQSRDENMADAAVVMVTNEESQMHSQVLKYTRDKLQYRNKEDLVILMEQFYKQIHSVSEELVELLQIRHEHQEQIEMRKIAIEQLLRLQNTDGSVIDANLLPSGR